MSHRFSPIETKNKLGEPHQRKVTQAPPVGETARPSRHIFAFPSFFARTNPSPADPPAISSLDSPAMAPNKYKAPRAAADPAVMNVRKPRAPKPRPPGLTTAEWKADVDRRQVVTGERAKRGEAKKKRDAAAAEEQASRAVMAKDRQQPRLPHASQYAQGVWAASQQSVVLLAKLLAANVGVLALA